MAQAKTNRRSVPSATLNRCYTVGCCGTRDGVDMSDVRWIAYFLPENRKTSG